MTKITEKEIQKLAELAKLELTDEEIKKFPSQIESILEYVEKLKEIETEGIEYKSHVNLENVMREDEVEKGLERDDAIGQAKNKEGYVAVPSVL